MKTISRFVMVSVFALIACTMMSSCDVFKPDINALHMGTVYNWSDSNLKIALMNPPTKYSEGTDLNNNYSIPRDFPAMNNGRPGVQSYWLHEKTSADPAYHFVLTSREGNEVGHIYVRPNGKDSDAPDPVNSQPGLAWWYSYPSGDARNATYEVDTTETALVVPIGGDR